jgi:hypothetical protein
MKLPPIPQTDNAQLNQWMRDVSNAVDREFLQYIPKRTATDSVLLASPNGSVYSVAVDDAGTLTATLVLG